jgi:hypothetical protein
MLLQWNHERERERERERVCVVCVRGKHVIDAIMGACVLCDNYAVFFWVLL